MSRAAALGAALYIVESTWGEDATPNVRMPVLDSPDLSGLMHEKIDATRVVQYLNDGTDSIDGIMGGTFRTRFYLTGHGSATSGSTPATSLPTLLQYVFGAAPAAPSGSTFTGGTATVPTTTASGTFSAGGICFAGAKGDGRADGQAAAISTHVTNTLTLLTALPAAPTNGDVLHSAEVVHVLELPASLAAVTGLSWRLMTANLQVDCHGCFARSVTITAPVNGELPIIDIEWEVSWWEFVSATFPTATSEEEFEPAPAGPGGSVFLNAVGTATRATRVATALTINVDLNVVPLKAPGGINASQAVVGARRNPMNISVEWEEEAPTATTTPQSNTDWDEQKHLLYTLNTVPGRRVALYFPRLCPTGNKPVQNQTDGQNRQMRRYRAYTGNTRTADLTASAMRIAFA